MNKLIIILALLLSSCMSANKHLEKFYKKGGKIEPIERTITVTDTIKGKDGKDSIIEHLVTVNCPEPLAPITRWRMRFDIRRFNDSIKVMRTMYKDSLRYSVKQSKIDTKRDIKELKLNNKKEIKQQKIEKRRFGWWFLGIAYLIFSLGIILWYVFIRKIVNNSNNR
jgi:hypothetical protein